MHRSGATREDGGRIPHGRFEATERLSPETGRTPDAFVLRCGPVDGGTGILALDAQGAPIAFKVGNDEEDALVRMREALGARRVWCEPALGGSGFEVCLVPRAAITSRASLLALVRARNVVPADATVEHMRVVLGAFAATWTTEPWAAGIELASIEVDGAVKGRWRVGPLWREGKLLGLAWLECDGPIERKRATFVVGGALQRMVVLFTASGFTGDALEAAFGFRQIPVPMRPEGPATKEEWVAMAAAMSAYGGLRTRERATASAVANGVECHATARVLGGRVRRRDS